MVGIHISVLTLFCKYATHQHERVWRQSRQDPFYGYIHIKVRVTASDPRQLYVWSRRDRLLSGFARTDVLRTHTHRGLHIHTLTHTHTHTYTHTHTRVHTYTLHVLMCTQTDRQTDTHTQTHTHTYIPVTRTCHTHTHVRVKSHHTKVSAPTSNC